MSTSSPPRIIFAGTPPFSATILARLLQHPRLELVAALTQPDRRRGRGKALVPSAVKQLASAHGITVHQPSTLRDAAFLSTLGEMRAELMVVVAYGLILPPEILSLPRLGCVNVHASLLPRWRGAAPIERAIEAGDSEAGVCIMQMDSGLDTGPILAESRCEISTVETGDSLRDKLAGIAAELLVATIDGLFEGKIIATAQSDLGVSYAGKLSKAEAEIDFFESAVVLERLIRAFVSSNLCFSTLCGERIIIWRAHALTTAANAAPGTIVGADANGIVVACAAGCLCLTRIQLPGGRALDCRDVLNSRAGLFAPGQKFGSSA